MNEIAAPARGRAFAILLFLAFFSFLALAPGAGAVSKKVDRLFPSAGAAGTQGGQFNTPRGIGINQATPADAKDGWIYVADANNHRIQAFDASGAFQWAIGRDVVVPGGTGDVVGPNEQQTVTLPALANGGTFTLTWSPGTGNQVTAAIAFNAPPSGAGSVQEALEGLAAINPGDVTVTSPNPGGGPAPGGPYTVEFKGAYADTDVSNVSGQGTELTLSSGTTKTISVATPVPGGNKAEKCTVATQCLRGVVGTEGGMFSAPQGVAINQTNGHLYIRDRENKRIQELDADGNFVRAFGWNVILNGKPGNNPKNEIQTVTLNASITGGTFVLNWSPPLTLSQTTAPIPFNAPPSGPGSVQEALEGLAAVNPGDVTVTSANPGGGAVPGGPYTVEFTGAFGDTDVSQITAATTELVGTTKTITVATTTLPGLFEVCASDPTDCKAGESGIRAGQLHAGLVSGVGGSTGIAVVPAGLPNAGNLIVGDGGSATEDAGMRVSEYEGDGDFVRSWGWDVAPTGAPGDLGTAFEICTTACQSSTAFLNGGNNGEFGRSNPRHVAVDANGVVYASDDRLSNRVMRFDSTKATTAQLLLPPLTSAEGLNTATTTAMAVNPADNHFLLARGTTEIYEYDPATNTVLADKHMVGSGLSATGLDVNAATGELYVSSNSSVLSSPAHRIYVADDDGASGALAVTFNPPTAVTGTTASFSGTVNPGGFPVDYRFEYSKTGTAPWTAVKTPNVSLGAGSSPVNVPVSPAEGNATGLEPCTLYFVRIAAKRGFGNGEVFSTASTFETDCIPPTAQTVNPIGVTDTSAFLAAQIDPNKSATSYRFEWGTDTGYGNSAPVPDGSAGNGDGEVLVTARIEGLQPGTTYHYRVVADNGNEVSPGVTAVTGSDVAFTTRQQIAQPQGRTYELVSPADKAGGVGVGIYYRTIASMALAEPVIARDAERIAVQGSFGSVLLDNAAFGYANDWALGEREGNTLGWRHHTPLTHPSRASALASFLNMNGSSENLDSFAWSSNSTPTFFPEMDGPAYDTVNDRTGWRGLWARWLSDFGSSVSPTRWELFGPGNLNQLINGPLGRVVPFAIRFSADGGTALGQTPLGDATGLLPIAHGLAGPGDPTWPSFGDLVSGRSLYLGDLSGGLTDSAQIGERELVNVCTGAAGPQRTQLPLIDAGKVSAQECQSAGAGRDSRLLSDHGASARVGNGGGDPPAPGSLSADGQRVFFLSPDPIAQGVPNGTAQFCSGSGSTTLCPPQLFVSQEMPDGSRAVRWISKAEPGLFGNQDASLIGTARLEGSTPDGDKVFFRSNAPLTADDRNGGGEPPAGGVTTGTPGANSWDLFVYDLPDDPNADPGTGTLTRISAGPDGGDADSRGDGDCNSPLPDSSKDPSNARVNALRFASADGNRVYFTCAAPLPGVPAPTNGTITSPGGTQTTADQTNLYLYDANRPAAERWSFVARLPRVVLDSGPSSGSLDVCASTGTFAGPSINGRSGSSDLEMNPSKDANCVSGTEDGAFLTLLTTGRLTADDPAATPTADIYAYDAEAEELVRISAPQGGAAGAYPCSDLVGTPLCHADNGITAISSHEGTINAPLNLVTDPATPGDRIAFFQSRAQLVPEDVDDDYDVYQWRNGDLSLISTGQSLTDGALYAGNDVSGKNVYFLTLDQLSWQDVDSVADLYSARVGTGVEEPISPPLCDVLADACQGASAGAPAASGASSSVFAGTGNVVEKPKPRKCGKGKVRRGNRCVPKNKGKAKNKGKKAKRAAHHDRRAHR